MLVLSRSQDDKILFPNLGVSVQILRIAGGKVRVGIDAPPEIKVLRHELEEQGPCGPPARSEKPRAASDRARPSKTPPSSRRLQRHLLAAAEALNNLHQLYGDGVPQESEKLIFEVFL